MAELAATEVDSRSATAHSTGPVRNGSCGKEGGGGLGDMITILYLWCTFSGTPVPLSSVGSADKFDSSEGNVM